MRGRGGAVVGFQDGGPQATPPFRSVKNNFLHSKTIVCSKTIC